MTPSRASSLSGGVVEGDPPSWRLPDGTQTTDPLAALAGALRAIADGDGAAVRDAEAIPAVGSTITVPSRARRHGAKRRRARLAHPPAAKAPSRESP